MEKRKSEGRSEKKELWRKEKPRAVPKKGRWRKEKPEVFPQTELWTK